MNTQCPGNAARAQASIDRVKADEAARQAYAAKQARIDAGCTCDASDMVPACDVCNARQEAKGDGREFDADWLRSQGDPA